MKISSCHQSMRKLSILNASSTSMIERSTTTANTKLRKPLKKQLLLKEARRKQLLLKPLRRKKQKSRERRLRKNAQRLKKQQSRNSSPLTITLILTSMLSLHVKGTRTCLPTSMKNTIRLCVLSSNSRKTNSRLNANKKLMTSTARSKKCKKKSIDSSLISKTRKSSWSCFSKNSFFWSQWNKKTKNWLIN